MIKVPFEWMPGSWGLKGKTKEIAKAEYELSGYDLELRLLEISKDDIGEDKFRAKALDLKLKYGMIDQPAYKRALIDLMADETLKKLATLELELMEGNISQLSYDKQHATLKNEPWVNVVKMEFSGKNSKEGSFELDWNEAFVDKLKADGYAGPSPDHIVNQWFMVLCRNVAMEEFDGTGDFAADSEANLETLKRWNSESFGDGRKGYS